MLQEFILKTVILGFLAVLSYFDLRYKKLPLTVILLFLLAGILYVIYLGDGQNLFRYLGVLSGMVFVAVSVLSRQAIGMGDALIFTILGLLLGIYVNLTLLFCAFLLSFVCFVFLLFTGKITLKSEIPFVPFLFLAYGGICCL